MKIYVVGASGFLGGRCAQYLSVAGHEVVTDRVEVTDLAELSATFQRHKPDVVINFAGVRAYPTIDWCEVSLENMVLTRRVNTDGAANVMLTAYEVGAYPIQVGSGCIYTGGPETPFTEDDEPNFSGSFYSIERMAMQRMLLKIPCLQLRIRMPLSLYPHDRNFIDKIAGYKRVISIPNSATLIEDLFHALPAIFEKKPLGILNATNDGYLTHEEVLEVYKELVDPSHEYELISLEELYRTETKAKRSNCVLSMDKWKSYGLPSMPPLTGDRLREVMKIYASNIHAK